MKPKCSICEHTSKYPLTLTKVPNQAVQKLGVPSYILVCRRCKLKMYSKPKKEKGLKETVIQAEKDWEKRKKKLYENTFRKTYLKTDELQLLKDIKSYKKM